MPTKPSKTPSEASNTSVDTNTQPALDNLIDEALDCFELFETTSEVNLNELTPAELFASGFLARASTYSEIKNILNDAENATVVDESFNVLDSIEDNIPPAQISNHVVNLPADFTVDLIKLLHTLLKANGVDISGYEDFHNKMSKYKTPFRTYNKTNH